MCHHPVSPVKLYFRENCDQIGIIARDEIVKDAELKIYEGGGHGLAQLQAAQFNADVLEFIRR